MASYKDAGVDLDAGARAVALMRASVAETHGPSVLAGVGAFGGLFDLEGLGHMTRPVLAASTDGVGTKVRLAARYGRLAGVGVDLVNHCIGDILVQGAEPLFFLDYVAASKLAPEDVAAVVGGMASACKAAGCALLGGETAEMPGVYADGELDLVGTVVGAVDRHAIIDGRRIEAGDVVIGLASSGPHTNGFSLIQHILEQFEIDPTRPEEALGDAAPLDLLLEPHRSYLEPVRSLRAAGVDLRGLVHITGGGLIDNPPRILPDGLAFVLDRDAWPMPPLFTWLQRLAKVPDAEMLRVFNCGLGLLAVLPAADALLARGALMAADVAHWTVGRIERRAVEPIVFEPPLTEAIR